VLLSYFDYKEDNCKMPTNATTPTSWEQVVVSSSKKENNYYIRNVCQPVSSASTIATIGLHIESVKNRNVLICPDIPLLQLTKKIITKILSVNFPTTVTNSQDNVIRLCEMASVSTEALVDLSTSIERYSQQRGNDAIMKDPVDDHVFAVAICCEPRLRAICTSGSSFGSSRNLHALPSATQLAQCIAKSIEYSRSRLENVDHDGVTPLPLPTENGVMSEFLNSASTSKFFKENKKKVLMETKKSSTRRLTSIASMNLNDLRALLHQTSKDRAHTMNVSTTVLKTNQDGSGGCDHQNSLYNDDVLVERNLSREVDRLRKEIEKNRNIEQTIDMYNNETKLSKMRTDALLKQLIREKEQHEEDMKKLSLTTSSKMSNIRMNMLNKFLIAPTSVEEDDYCTGVDKRKKKEKKLLKHEQYHEERRRQSITMYQNDWKERWEKRENEHEIKMKNLQNNHNQAMLHYITEGHVSSSPSSSPSPSPSSSPTKRSAAYQVLLSRLEKEEKELEILVRKSRKDRIKKDEIDIIKITKALDDLDRERAKWRRKSDRLHLENMSQIQMRKKKILSKIRSQTTLISQQCSNDFNNVLHIQ
jgi:hypothetical protein